MSGLLSGVIGVRAKVIARGRSFATRGEMGETLYHGTMQTRNTGQDIHLSADERYKSRRSCEYVDGIELL